MSFTLPSEEIIEKKRQTIEKFLTIEEQLEYGPNKVLVQIERGMETRQVLEWFQQAQQDLGSKVTAGALHRSMKCNGERENWCNGWMGSRWSDMTLNGRLVRIAFYERSEDPDAFAVYSDWQTKYDKNGEFGKYQVKANWHKYLLVVNPYYFDETNDKWRVEKKNPICCLCNNLCENQYGNNPHPLRSEGVCCDGCNIEVIRKRILEESIIEVDAAAAAEAALLAELESEPKPVKVTKKAKKPEVKICRCGNKDCMPRPKAIVMVNGVQRDQTFLQQNWDKKHSK